jgi:hypothetical protein
MKPTRCTCTHKGFPIVPRIGQYSPRFARFQYDNQNKQNSIVDKLRQLRSSLFLQMGYEFKTSLTNVIFYNKSGFFFLVKIQLVLLIFSIFQICDTQNSPNFLSQI